MLGKLIDPLNYLKKCLSEKIDLYQDHTFTIETPGLGRHTIGSGKKYLELFASDSLLHDMLLCRCNIAAAREEGKLAIVAGNEKNIDILEKIFPLQTWKYFQIDYV